MINKFIFCIALLLISGNIWAGCECLPVDIEHYIDHSQKIVFGEAVKVVEKDINTMKLTIEVDEWLKVGDKNQKTSTIEVLSPKQCVNPLSKGIKIIVFIENNVTTRCSAELLIFYDLPLLYGSVKEKYH